MAPYFSLARAAWIPYALTWDPETGEFHGVEGPRGFATYREAVEASRFLVGAAARLRGAVDFGRWLLDDVTDLSGKNACTAEGPRLLRITFRR